MKIKNTCYKRIFAVYTAAFSLALLSFAHVAVSAEDKQVNVAIQRVALNKNADLSGLPYKNTPASNVGVDANLPELGDVSQTVLSPLDEQRIAEQILHDVYTSDEVVQDPEITDYLQLLGNRLVNSSENKNQKFTFFAVKDSTINAFAMPGGVVGVHTGLILAANNESELAGVLGHEIGHVTQHHLARMLASQKYDTFKSIAGIALALLAARANPDLANAAITTSTAYSVQNQLDYTREHEREADRVGLQILNNAGFDVRAMPAFFTTLQRGNRFSEGGAPSFLRTHPLTAERIADVANRVEQMPYKQVVDSADFQYVRAKLRVRAMLDDRSIAQDPVDLFQQNLRERRYVNEAAEHYALASAYLQKKAYVACEKELSWLRKNAPTHAMIENLAANLAIAKDDPSAAAPIYSAALAKFPDNRALIYGYAAHYLAIKQADNMLKLLANKQRFYPNDAYLYELKSRAYAMQKKELLSHQALGEAYYRKYDLKHAIEQMEIAMRAKDGDFYEKSILEARLKELQRMQADAEKTKNAT